MTIPLNDRIPPSGPVAGGQPPSGGAAEVIARKHGVTSSSTPIALTTGAYSVIPGLGGTPGTDFLVDIAPNYFYDFEVFYPVRGVGVTLTGSWKAAYSFYEPVSATWTAWTQFPDASGLNHVLTGTGTFQTPSTLGADCETAFSPGTTRFTKMRIGLQGDTVVTYVPEQAFCRVYRYANT
jgi:hypothetical protein